MGIKDNDLTNSIASNRNWCWLLALGILFEILGVLGLGMVVSVTLASMILIGMLVLIAGVFQVIDVFKSKNWKAIIWHLLIALLYIFVGAIFIYDPLFASAMMTIILAYTLIIIGIMRCFMAFSIKQHRGWFWILLAGIAALVLGIMLLMQWPMSGLWFIGLIVSIELMISGWSYIFLAVAMKQ